MNRELLALYSLMFSSWSRLRSESANNSSNGLQRVHSEGQNDAIISCNDSIEHVSDILNCPTASQNAPYWGQYPLSKLTTSLSFYISESKDLNLDLCVCDCKTEFSRIKNYVVRICNSTVKGQAFPISILVSLLRDILIVFNHLTSCF